MLRISSMNDFLSLFFSPISVSTIPYLEVVCSTALAKILKVGFVFQVHPEVYYLLLILGIDSRLADNFGRSVMYGLSGVTTIITVSYVGGLPFIFATFVLGIVYWNGKRL